MESTSNAMVEHQQLRKLRQSWTSRHLRFSVPVAVVVVVVVVFVVVVVVVVVVVGQTLGTWGNLDFPQGPLLQYHKH